MSQLEKNKETVSRETNQPASTVSKNLGRGLDSLLGPKTSSLDSQKKEGLSMLPLTALEPSRYQPRNVFDESQMQDLAASIKENGVLQPILIRPTDKTDKFGSIKYEIIAGERRWRASKLAGRKVIPVVIRHLTDKQALESGLVENIQRDDLDAIEEANGYQRLIDEFSYTQEKISKIIGKSRSHIANTLRLLSLPQSVRLKVEKGLITAGHARLLVGQEKADEFATLFSEKGLNVRQAEALVGTYNKTPFDLSDYKSVLFESAREKSIQKGKRTRDTKTPATQKPDDIIALENELKSALGLPTAIHMKENLSGHVQIYFKNPGELDRFMNLIFGSL